MPKLMMPAQSEFKGSGFNEAFSAGVNAAAPFEHKTAQLKTEAEDMRRMGVQDQQKTQALKYQELLRTGADGMRKYAAEVGNEFPELGQQLSHEAEQYAGFMQDPALTGANAEEYAHNFYSSADSRVKAIKEAKQPKPIEAKAWVPTTKDEWEESKRFEADLKDDAGRPGSRGGSAGDRARAEKRMAALRKLPAIWAQIEEFETGIPISKPTFDPKTGKSSPGSKGVPLIEGTAKPDTEAYARGLSMADEGASKRIIELRKSLNALESDAGLKVTTDIKMGPGRDSSASYKLYSGSKNTESGATPATAVAAKPAGKSAPRNTMADAEDWLKDPKNKGKKQYAAILAQVSKARMGAKNGL